MVDHEDSTVDFVPRFAAYEANVRGYAQHASYKVQSAAGLHSVRVPLSLFLLVR
jgi:hypothetical protein